MSPEIDAFVTQRRTALRALKDLDASIASDLSGNDRVWGLALSGGGIRSATFCFGLLQALSKKDLLLRFDLLSTVSGGGYIGSFLGRLFSRAQDGTGVRRIMGGLQRGADSWFAWWLRANGRYLIPAGVRDTLYAGAIYFRNMLGVHIELGLLGILVGALLSMIDTGVWAAFASLYREHGRYLETYRDWINDIPTVWVFLVFPVIALAVACWAFWTINWVAQSFTSLVIAAAVIGFVALVLYGSVEWKPENDVLSWFTPTPTVAIAFACVAALWIGSALLAFRVWSWAGVHVKEQYNLPDKALVGPRYDAARNRLTNWLARCFWTIGALLLIGLLDRFAWWLSFDSKNLSSAGLLLAAAAATLRAALAPTSGLRAMVANSAVLPVVLSVVGRIATFGLMAFWVAIVHRYALGAIFATSTPNFSAPTFWVMGTAALVVPYVLLTGMNTKFLNLSSLHGFYRARLVRSYLGASNPDRFVEDPATARALDKLLATEPVNTRLLWAKRSVLDDEAFDDVDMVDYAPHNRGGPVHMLNMCLNETRSPRGQLFNQDRKGRSLTVAAGALLRVGVDPWQPIVDPAERLTLGSWTAISGAAVSPGLGNLTRGGISALIMFAGARLGYWWDAKALLSPISIWRSPFTKSLGLINETLGFFNGKDDPRSIEGKKFLWFFKRAAHRDWFLTDGGHFENTGAYALLTERAEVIVLADCGADPNYQFDNLENLVRKARIDLQVEVTFQKPRDELRNYSNGDSDDAFLNVFGSLREVAADGSRACFALAKIEYPAITGDGLAVRGAQRGHLLLIKPNMCNGLPVDLLNFKRDFPLFPQQSTADQFFSEAQWESYFRLGSLLGEHFSKERIDYLLANVDSYFVDDDGAVPENELPAVPTPNTLGRVAAGAAGIGALGVAGVALWQGYSTYRTSVNDQAKVEQVVLRDLSRSWAAQATEQTPQEHLKALNQTAAMLATLSETLCKDGASTWFNRSHLAVEIYKSTLTACAHHPSSEVCQRLVDASKSDAADGRRSCFLSGNTLSERRYLTNNCARYWGYDYRTQAVRSCANAADYAKPAKRPGRGPDGTGPSPAPSPAPAQVSVSDQKKFASCRGNLVLPYAFDKGNETLALEIAARWQKSGIDVGPVATQLPKDALPRATRPSSFTIRFYDPESVFCADLLGTQLHDEYETVGVQLEPDYTVADHRQGLIELLVPALPETDKADPEKNGGPAISKAPAGPPPNPMPLAPPLNPPHQTPPSVEPSRGGDHVYIFNAGSGSCPASSGRKRKTTVTKNRPRQTACTYRSMQTGHPVQSERRFPTSSHFPNRRQP